MQNVFSNLLNFYFSASCNKFLFDSFCICFRNAFFYNAVAFNKVFCFFKTKTGDRSYFFDDVKFVCAFRLKNNVELRFFFCRSCCRCCRTSCYSYRSCCLLLLLSLFSP